jgi:cytoskeleton protein RodZ
MDNTNNSSPPTATATVISLGQHLKKCREDKNLSIKQISQQTKINTTQLELLESDQITKLPNKAYVIGYVKSYTKTLNLNLEQCLKLLEETYRTHQSSNTPVHSVADTEARDSSNSTSSKKGLWLGIGALAIVGIIFLVTHRPASKTENTLVEERPVSTPEAVVESNSAPLVTTEGIVIPDIQESKAQEPISLAQNTPVTLKPTILPVVAPTVAAIKPTAAPTAAPTAVVINTAAPKEDLSLRSMPAPLYTLGEENSDDTKLIPQPIKGSVVPGKQNIFIAALEGDSWLTFKRDNEPVKKMMLKKGENIKIIGDEVRIFAGNVTAIKIFLNNRPVNFQSTTGLKSLVFPESSAGKYKLPLFIFKEDGSVMTSDQKL